MGKSPRLLSARLLVAASFFVFFSTPVSANTCVVGCHGMKTGKGYQEGHTYTYDFEGTSVTSVSEGKGDSTVKLSAAVELSVKPDCVRQVKLRNVQLNGKPVELKDVEQYALQFNYHDGHVDTSICAEPKDSQASLNIKRAVISLFQTAVLQDNGVTTHREVDVFGNCETDFEFRKEGDKLIVRKHKNLATCSYRENMRHGLIYSSYDDSSEIKTTPILDSQQKSEQTFKNGILNSGKSTEVYVYKPFANGDAGAKTVVQSSLVLKSEKASDKPTASVSIPKSLVFEAPHPIVDSSAGAIIKSLKAVKDASGTEIKDKAAEKFGEFIKVLRKSNKNDILAVYDKLKAGSDGFDKNTDRKILLDALFRAGTGEAAEVAVELIKRKELQEYQKFGYLASLALVDHIHLPAVTAVASLLDEKDLPRIGYLGVGNAIGKYCRDHNCENVPEIKAALGKILSKINNGKASNRKAENNIIAAFKALGNTRYLDDPTIAKIVAIAGDPTVHNRVRVAAIEALPAKCTNQWQTPLLDVFANKEEDSEIRIKAYLSLVACPSAKVANRIKEIIDVESVNQVGSFVTSHLRNLRASTDPSKISAKKHFSEIRPRTKFPEDFRKFSFNNEFSYTINSLGIGSTVEQNVIYSQKSFVPRSINVNLTSEIFGRSFNFLEIDTRIENLDRLIEHYFGPKGVIKHADVAELVVNGKKTFDDVYNNVKERIEKTGRGRRAAINPQDVDKFSKTIKSHDDDVIDDDFDIDLSLKMFGVELAFMDFKESDGNQFKDSNAAMDKIFGFIRQLMNKAKNYDYSSSNHLHFMDVDLVYPTGLGFPLTVGVQGNGVTHLKSNGKIDVQSIMKDPKNALIKIGFEPSASITISASLLIDTFGVDNGLKVIGNLHTSTGGDLSLKLIDGNGFDINFGIPKRKQEIISVSSEVVFVDNNGVKTPVKFTKGKEHSDCFEQFSTILGLTICGHFSYPYESLESIEKRPLFPISGPAKFAVSIENNDATSYHFRAFYDKSKENHRSLELLFETPKSRNNRRVSVNVEGVNKPTQKYIKATFDSPFKQASGQLLLDNSDKKKALTLSLKHDDDDYYGSVGIVANDNKYKPILEYKIPDHIEKLSGGKGKGGKATYKVDGDIQVINQEPNKKYVFDKVALYGSGKKISSLDGFLVTGPGLLTVDANIALNEENLHVKLDGKRNDNGFNVELSAVPSKDKNIGFHVDWRSDSRPEGNDNKFVLTYGPDLQSKTNRLTIIDRLAYKKSDRTAHSYIPLSSLSSKMEVTWPAQDFSAKLETELDHQKFESEFDFHYGKFKFGNDLEIKIDENVPANWEFSLESHVIDNKLVLSLKQKKMSDTKKKIEGKLEVPGSKYEMEAITQYQVEGSNANIDFDGKLKLNSKQLQLKYGFEKSPQKVSSHALVVIDNTKFFDFLMKAAKEPNNYNGEFNLYVKKSFMTDGKFTYQNGKGTATLTIDLPKFSRKIKGSADVAVTGPRHVANLEILLDAEKDPNKRIKLSTDTELTKNAVDTKNVIDILSYKTEINGKGKIAEKAKDSFDFEGNFDVHLPGGRYIVGNGKGSVDRKSDQREYHGQYELLHYPKKGEKARKISYDHELSMSVPKRSNFKAKNQLKLVDYDGKDMKFNIDTDYNEVPNSDSRKGEIKLSAGGSYLPKSLHFNFASDCKNKNEGAWKLESLYGNDLSVKGTGNYVHGYHDKKANTADVNIQCVFPSDKLRNLAYSGKSSLLLPHEDMKKFEYKTLQSLKYNDDKDISGDLHVQHNACRPGEKCEGSGKLILGVLQHPPLAIDTSYTYDPTAELKKGGVAVDATYGEKKINLKLDSFYKLDLTHIGMDLEATTPAEKLRNFKIGFERKRQANGPWLYNIHAITDQKKYDMTSGFDITPNSHEVNVVLTCPEGKTEIHSKVNKLGENEFKGDWSIISPKGFAAADAHVVFENIDDFNMEFNFDSDKIKERKLHATLVSKPGANAGKKIIITVTSDGKNLVTGSTTFSKREEPGKVIVEGNGSLKIGEDTKNSKFMYSRKQLTRENDGETGVAILLNANFGPSAVVGELKLSDKEVHVFNSFCEQNKDCAHFKLQSILDTDHATRMNHQITVEIDLKKFYVPVEFGLKTTTEYHPKKPSFDHTANLYLHTSKDKTQYSSHIYMHAKDAGVIFTVPNREFAFISSVDLPKATEVLVGPFKIEISTYLDRKNHPNEKTSLTISGDVNIEKTSAALSGEARFIYPKQTKDMVIKGNLNAGKEHLFDANVDFDIFAKKTQKITINASIMKNAGADAFNVTGALDVTSRDQQLKLHLKQNIGLSKSLVNYLSSFTYYDKNQKLKTLSADFEASPKELHLKLQGPNSYILQVHSKIDFEKNLQKIETEYHILDASPVIVSAELRDMRNFIYQSYKQAKPEDKFVVSGKAVIGQVIEFHADLHKGGEKKNLFGVAIYLDESRFLKPNLSYNKENVAQVIDFYRDEMIKYLESLKKFTKEIGDEANVELKDLFDHLEKAQPNWKPMIEYYQTELNRLKEEINNDRTLHEIIAAYDKIFGGLTKAVIQIMKELAQRLEELHKQLNEICQKIREAMQTTWPSIKESLDKISKALIEVMDAMTKLSATYLKAIINIINEHQKELKEIAAIATDIIHDLVKIITKGYNQIEGELKNFVTTTIQQLKALPVYEIIKKQWDQISTYQIPEAVLMPIEEACVQLKKLLPTEELREFLTITYNYIMKHIRRQKVDESSEIKNIYTSGIDAVRSVITLLQQGEIKHEFYGLFGDNLYKNFGVLKHLPGLPILKISIINIIRNGDLPTIGELYHAYRPTAYMSDIIPPFSKTGIVVEGGHFFTFDGRHLTTAGTCDYMLAHDIRDGNFSIIGTFNNGKFISLTITAPGESITLKSNGNILIDDKPSEYPANTKNLHAFLTLPIVNVKSDYGVHVACSQKAPMICSVHVSGFYHGKLRGIFGDADNEPYDDFTLPSGHVTENESDFGNAYRLNQACPAAPAVDHQHSHARNPTCTEYFSEASSMSGCFSYVNPATFRQACDHATAAGTPRAACLISAAYYAACRKERVPISIPAACGSCKVGKDIAIGDSFSVKVPNKQADIIFVIEQTLKNEKIFQELVTPLMTEIKNEFKHHGINDVHVGLIGYADHMKWPQHYTTGGSTNINGDVKNMKFKESEPLISFKEAKEGDTEKRLNYLEQRADVELGTFKLTDAYEEAISYPFRTGAAKAVIGIIDSPCEKSPFLLSLQQLRLIMGQKVYRDLGLTYYHVGFLNDILVSGKMQKNVVGYDAKFAYTFSDSKKKPLEGSIDKENVVLTSGDVCAGFSVSSGGAAFSSNNFLEAKPNQRKQFLQVAARRVVDGVTSVELEEDCICKQHLGLNGYASCRIVGRKEKEAKHK